jgi:hypothetical protein
MKWQTISVTTSFLNMPLVHGVEYGKTGYLIYICRTSRFILYPAKYGSRRGLQTRHLLQTCYSFRRAAGNVFELRSWNRSKHTQILFKFGYFKCTILSQGLWIPWPPRTKTIKWSIIPTSRLSKTELENPTCWVNDVTHDAWWDASSLGLTGERENKYYICTKNV